jgi:hypothetical protein
MDPLIRAAARRALVNLRLLLVSLQAIRTHAVRENDAERLLWVEQSIAHAELDMSKLQRDLKNDEDTQSGASTS